MKSPRNPGLRQTFAQPILRSHRDHTRDTVTRPGWRRPAITHWAQLKIEVPARWPKNAGCFPKCPLVPRLRELLVSG